MDGSVATILVALFGALLGGLITFVVQAYNALHRYDVDLLNDYISDLEEIEDLAFRYWLAHENGEDIKNVADKLRARLDSLGHFRADAERLLQSKYCRFVELDGQLFDAATGGPFQTKSRDRSPERARDVAATVSEIRALMRRARANRYWTR